MENIPKIIEQQLLQDDRVELSDWVKNAFDVARPLVVNENEIALADLLIQESFKAAQTKSFSLEVTLAAAFDLLVAAEYYSNVTNGGWYYCNNGEPGLFYPYTNICPRCRLKGAFFYEVANKPASGIIGQATSRLLGVYLSRLFAKTGKNLRFYQGAEPIDLLVYDEKEKVMLLAEIKAAPLVTLPLVIAAGEQTNLNADGNVAEIASHYPLAVADLTTQALFMLLPTFTNKAELYRLINLGSATSKGRKSAGWAYGQISKALEDRELFKQYLDFWTNAFGAYETKATSNTTFWFTNGCGQPSPRL